MSQTQAPAALARVLRGLPRGGALPAALWARRHAGIVALLWAHVPALFAMALFQGYDPLHAAAEVGLVALAASLATWTRLGRKERGTVATVGLFTCSALLVHFSGGVTEMHFHFFVMVVVVTLYQDWFPFLVGIAYVLLHHGVMGSLEPEGVYGTPAAIANPWGWAAIHAGFILAASVACLVAWKRSEEYATQIGRDELRRKEALELNDHVVQGLVVAKASFEVGDDDGGKRALEATLARAKQLVSDLLGEDGRADALPGGLVRDQPAAVERP
ncbi:MAG: hypothetical protein M3323_10995 [Actinomycetota bacterium]|nr:hypothetical protein [Actinomycetota bacterium]